MSQEATFKVGHHSGTEEFSETPHNRFLTCHLIGTPDRNFAESFEFIHLVNSRESPEKAFLQEEGKTWKVIGRKI